MNEENKSFQELFNKTQAFQSFFYFSFSIYNSTSFISVSTATFYYETVCSFNKIFSLLLLMFYIMIIFFAFYENMCFFETIKIQIFLTLKHIIEIILIIILICFLLEYDDCLQINNPCVIFFISAIITQLLIMIITLFLKNCFRSLNFNERINNSHILEKQDSLIFFTYTVSHGPFVIIVGIFTMIDIQKDNISNKTLILFKLIFWLTVCLFILRNALTIIMFKYFNNKNEFYLKLCEKLKIFIIINSIAFFIVVILTIYHFYSNFNEKNIMINFYFRMIVLMGYYSFSLSIFSYLIYILYFIPKGYRELREKGLLVGINAYIIN